MMETKKKEIMPFGKDQWEVVYKRLSEMCGVRIEVRLIRPCRKWYQSRFLAIDFGYWLADSYRKMDEEELRGYASRMIEKIYISENQDQALDKFFSKE